MWALLTAFFPDIHICLFCCWQKKDKDTSAEKSIIIHMTYAFKKATFLKTGVYISIIYIYIYIYIHILFLYLGYLIVRFQNGSNKVLMGLRVVQYLWFQIELALRARSILKSRVWFQTKFTIIKREIWSFTRMISDQIYHYKVRNLKLTLLTGFQAYVRLLTGNPSTRIKSVI